MTKRDVLFPQIATTARTPLEQSQEPKIPSKPPTCRLGIQALGPLSATSQAHQKVARFEAKQLALKNQHSDMGCGHPK